jgi:hypothetical protein
MKQIEKQLTCSTNNSSMMMQWEDDEVYDVIKSIIRMLQLHYVLHQMIYQKIETI